MHQAPAKQSKTHKKPHELEMRLPAPEAAFGWPVCPVGGVAFALPFGLSLSWLENTKRGSVRTDGEKETEERKGKEGSVRWKC